VTFLVGGLIESPRLAADGNPPEIASAGLAIGDHVILEDPATTLRDGDSSVGSGGERLFKIERLSAPFAALATSDGSVRGWVKLDQILPLDRAIEHFSRKLRADTRDRDAYLARGRVWIEKREWDRALADLGAAIRLAPGDARAHHLSGQAWTGKSQFDRAVADFSEAIRLNPQLACAFRDRGLAWDRKRYFDRALADMSEAIRLEPTNFDLVLTRGKLCSARGRHHQAMADFERLIRARPHDPTGYVARGEELMEDLQADMAIAEFTRALDVDPMHIPALLLRAKAWKRKYDHARAISDSAEAVHRAPGDPQAHQALAWILATCPQAEFRDGRRAVDEGTRACELTDWRRPDELNALAAACAEAGDYASAVKWQSRAVELLALDDKSRPLFNRRLFIYEAGHPYRD
jgi:tetratricopeptide (TPR) repeat protein